MFDLVIKNGIVIDGTFAPSFQADIGIRNGIIIQIGAISSNSGHNSINAKNLVISPGFIDVHSHSDFSLLINPKAESKVRQGVTTEVIGNCGFSAAPISEKGKEEYEKTLSILEGYGIDWDWYTMKEYLERLERLGIAINVVPLVGHSNIRASVLGFENRKPSSKEMQEMKSMVAQAMMDGAFGLSSGLIYPPGCYGDTKELIELCKIVTRFGGIYTSHIRGESDTLFNAINEAIRIGEVAHIPVEISHLKLEGETNWGKAEELLNIINDARKKGIDISGDVYPYTAGSFKLSAMLPPWVSEKGIKNLIKNLQSLDIRRRIKTEMIEGRVDWSSPFKVVGWDKTIVSYCKKLENKEFEGKTIAEIAKAKLQDPFDFVFGLLIDEEAKVMVIRFSMHEQDVRVIIKSKDTMIGSDGRSIAPYGSSSSGKPHPRFYGTFPRVLKKYVKEDKILTMEEAIRKMTSLPAKKFDLKDRGVIKSGAYADIVIFDPNQIEDKATFMNPHQYPKGVEYVIVNGDLVIEQTEHTGNLAGTVLRK